MGNKFGRRRQVVDDKYTRPQGLYPIKDVDYKKLRKLILESKLAPCFPGGDEPDFGLLEECPICFLHYPTVNRSRCCMKSICTECFLQMKNPNSARPTQCPFCKASNYAVEYRGVKSKEERGLEQVEEQKVIEAKIRMRQQELREEEERMHKRQETSSSVGVTHAENINSATPTVVERETLVSSRDSVATPLLSPSLNIQQNRGDELDLDLEDIMVMEAIWLSIQENENQNYPSYESPAPEQYSPPITEPLAGPSSSSSPSGGLACAVAALAERRQVSGDQPSNYSGHIFHSDMLPSSSRRASRTKKTKGNYSAWRDSDDLNIERVTTMSEVGDWGSIDHGSEVAEAGTSYASSIDSDGEGGAILPPPMLPPQSLYRASVAGYTNGYTSETRRGFNDLLQPPPPLPRPLPLPRPQPLPLPLPPTYVGDGSFQPIPGPIVPESFEEQMMLAMAVSLAEARAITAAQKVAWH